MTKNTIITIIILLLCLFLIGCFTEHNYTITNPSVTPSVQSTPNKTFPVVTPEEYEIRDFYAKNNGTRLYIEPNTDSQITAVLSSGDFVELIDIVDSFYHVSYGETKGYVQSDVLSHMSVDPISLPDLENYEITEPKIVVIKSLHILELWDDDILIFSADAQIGENEDGRKEVGGDKKTPEGQYYVCMTNAGSKYHLGLYISYPNAVDAQIAYDSGKINYNTYTSITRAIARYSTPPFDTILGGYIAIHGKVKGDSTLGCIGIDDEYLDIIWDNCPIRTPVLILP